MKRSLVLFATLAVGCSGQSQIGSSPMSGKVPKLDNLTMLAPHMPVSGGAYAIMGGAAPGTATFDHAGYFDGNGSTPPSQFGTGNFSIAIGATTYAGGAPSLYSAAGVFTDASTSKDYLAVFANDVDTAANLGKQVLVLTLASDFGVGKTVTFDGVDRMAFFGIGDPNSDPSAQSVATSGSITFTAGSLALGDSVTANLSADFGAFEWIDATVPTNPGNPDGGVTACSTDSDCGINAACRNGTCWSVAQPDPTNAAPAPGAYQISYTQTGAVACDGTLIGHEALFAAITAQQAGFTADSVTIATGPNATMTIDGANLETMFNATAPIELDFDGTAWDGQVNDNFSQTGPLSTQRVYAGIFFTPAGLTTSQVQVTIIYANAANDSCNITYDAALQ